MKLMRLAICVAVFALVGGIAFSQDMDIRALQAKLAAQEARLNDLQAKMNYSANDGGTADNLLSLRKTGKLTIGGDLKIRMYEQIGKVESRFNGLTATGPGPGAPLTARADGMGKIRDLKANDFRVNDAKLRFKVDVNDYFEAFIRVDLQDTTGDRAVTAQEAYVRWKNVCNSGFGLMVGRGNLVFGGGSEDGAVYTGFYGGKDNESIGELGNPFWRNAGLQASGGPNLGDYHPGMFANGNGMAPSHTGYDYSRTTQITPSWETQDGRFKAELSYIQSLDMRAQGGFGTRYSRGAEDHRSINSGFGSGSARLTWKPIEGLKLVASAINYHNNVVDGAKIPTYRSSGGGYITLTDGTVGNKNNTAVNLHVAWNPCFLPAFKIWAAWVHDWNAGYVDDLDADMFHAGISYKFTDKFSAFGVGEYMRHKSKGVTAQGNGSEFYKSKAWASYVGVMYDIGYGVSTELGWRHEDYKFKGKTGGTHTKAKLDTIYGQLTYLF